MNQEKKFKYDICRVLGHECDDQYSYVCTRCGYNIITEELRERLSIQFVGRKITSELPHHIQAAAHSILTDAMTRGDIMAFHNLRVARTDSGWCEVRADIFPPWDTEYVTISITF